MRCCKFTNVATTLIIELTYPLNVSGRHFLNTCLLFSFLIICSMSTRLVMVDAHAETLSFLVIGGAKDTP